MFMQVEGREQAGPVSALRRSKALSGGASVERNVLHVAVPSGVAGLPVSPLHPLPPPRSTLASPHNAPDNTRATPSFPANNNLGPSASSFLPFLFLLSLLALDIVLYFVSFSDPSPHFHPPPHDVNTPRLCSWVSAGATEGYCDRVCQIDSCPRLYGKGKQLLQCNKCTDSSPTVASPIFHSA